MQKTSMEYRSSMKSSLRERAFIWIIFGLVNQEAQANASIDSGEFAFYSNTGSLFSEGKDDTVYATLEEGFTRVDGSMFFLPRQNTYDTYLDTGLISYDLVSNKVYELMINLHTAAIDFKGLTIIFGENYPIEFDVMGSNGQIIEVRGNTMEVFSMEEVIENTTYVKLTFHSMKNPQSRLRIYSIRFGYGLVYSNDSVMSSTLNSYISPIGADVPQIDFLVQLKNYDRYFNVDNPKSAINFLEPGQEMEIYYGYQLPDTGEVERIKGYKLLCSEWESDDFTATIRCHDIFRNMDSEYFRGLYSSVGKSYFDLALEILEDAKISYYYIDPRLKKLFSRNPMPRVKHKEALQIIANACRCVLSQTRDGKIRIKSSFVPESAAYSNGESAYSNVANILDDNVKDEYSSYAVNYPIADGGMYFLPPNTKGIILNTGYVSSTQSDENGYFTTNPTVTIVQEAACMYYGVRMVFGHALPAEITICTYNDGELVDEYQVTEEIIKNLVIIRDFDDFDTMKIEFPRTAEPYNRIVLNRFSFGDITDFTMSRTDMTSSPKAIRQELIKEVIVPCFIYQNGTDEDLLVSEEITAKVNESQTYFVGEPSYRFRATFDNNPANVSILSWGNYFITISFNVAGTCRLDIYGIRYRIVERHAVRTLNARGKTIKWENPLISDMEMANDLAEWLSDYYASGIEYEYSTRGNPEIDVNDIVYQENEFQKNMRVNIYRSTLVFKQSFAGKVTARRIGG